MVTFPLEILLQQVAELPTRNYNNENSHFLGKRIIE